MNATDLKLSCAVAGSEAQEFVSQPIEVRPDVAVTLHVVNVIEHPAAVIIGCDTKKDNQ